MSNRRGGVLTQSGSGPDPYSAGGYSLFPAGLGGLCGELSLLEDSLNYDRAQRGGVNQRECER